MREINKQNKHFKTMPRTNFQELLDAGVHFGHLARKWNPKMAPYIFDQKNGIHIIDLHKSIVKIEEAANVLKQLARSGRKVLFVATKKQAKEIVAEKAAHIHKIVLYIAEEFGADIALQKLEELERQLKLLADDPYIGVEPRYMVLRRQGYKVLILEKNLVFYKIDETNKTVTIYAVVDQRQNYLNIIRGL